MGPMIRKVTFCLLSGLVFGLNGLAGADRFDDEICATRSHIKVFCLVTETGKPVCLEENPSRYFPAMIDGGTEIIPAGEPGGGLGVFSIEKGHVIYCGLPFLEMAAELNVEAVHLMANLLNFGYGT